MHPRTDFVEVAALLVAAHTVVADPARWCVNRRAKLTPDRRAKLTPLSVTAEVVPVVNRGDPRGFV